MDSTGSVTRGSHTRTVPSREHVTISGAPPPIFKPPQPSMALTICLWACTEYTAFSGRSKSLHNHKPVS